MRSVYNLVDTSRSGLNNLRIEVKSSRVLIQKGRKYWNFHNEARVFTGYGNNVAYTVTKRKRNCDFYICICYENDIVVKEYIVPNEVFGNRSILSIPHTPINTHICKDYLNRWDLLK